jgi:hypothetical protein
MSTIKIIVVNYKFFIIDLKIDCILCNKHLHFIIIFI